VETLTSDSWHLIPHRGDTPLEVFELIQGRGDNQNMHRSILIVTSHSSLAIRHWLGFPFVSLRYCQEFCSGCWMNLRFIKYL
jgi:hypothetical protein